MFFALVLPASWLLMHRPVRWRLFMLAASLLFYGAWSWPYVLLLSASIVGNHTAARWVERGGTDNARRIRTVVSVAGNLAALGWFKYAGFLGRSGTGLLERLGLDWELPAPDVVLPIGISFFTFQALSYVIDVSRRRLRPVPLLDVAVYLAFFPHLVAGPIVRASEFLPQLRTPRDPRGVDLSLALWLIALGLFKKVVIASYLADAAADPVFGFPEQHGGLEALVGVYAYAIQIYADFSGYTDIAIGVALLLGFRFPVNFDAPYTATSLQDFWRRWHITLSRWLRDYLYIPLGGSHGRWRRTYRNLVITMVLGGLWHGAGFTFVLWGALHGLGLSAERWWRNRPSGSYWRSLGGDSNPGERQKDEVFVVKGAARVRGGRVWVQRLVTFHVVCLAWVFFRAPNVGDALTLLARIAFHGSVAAVDPLVLLVIAAMLAAQYVPTDAVARLLAAVSAWSLPRQVAAGAGALLAIDVLGPTGVPPFIYFQF